MKKRKITIASDYTIIGTPVFGDEHSRNNKIETPINLKKLLNGESSINHATICREYTQYPIAFKAIYVGKIGYELGYKENCNFMPIGASMRPKTTILNGELVYAFNVNDVVAFEEVEKG